MSTATAPAAPRAAVSPAPLPLSTLTIKYLMGLTGLGLILFLILHMAGNLLVFKGAEALNAYGQWLRDLGPALWVARIGLLALFILHVYLALKIRQRNTAARPQRYVVERTLQASTPSQYMLMTGVVILLFVVFHLAHYTFGLVHQVPSQKQGSEVVVMKNLLDLRDAKGRHDIYTMVVHACRQWWIVLAYVAAQLVLASHLAHGASSWFQSLGINHPRYNVWLWRLGILVAVVIAVGNISMPVAIWTGMIGQEVPSVAP